MGQAVTPFCLSGDQPDNSSIVVERQPDEVGAETSKDLPLALGISRQRPEIVFYVGMEAEQEDRHGPGVAADEILLIGLGQKAGHDFAEQAVARRQRKAVWIASVRTKVIRVRMEIDCDLRVEMFAGIEMSGFEIGAQAVDKLRADSNLLLQEQMTVVALNARVRLEPGLRRCEWRLTRVHSSPRRWLHSYK